MIRPTTEFTLRIGWKVTLVDYFSQGDVEELAKVFADKTVVHPGLDKDGKMEAVPEISFTASIKFDQNRRAKELAVKKLVAPDGEVFEGENLNIESIMAIPHDPEGDQINELIESHCYPKKKVAEGTSSGG